MPPATALESLPTSVAPLSLPHVVPVTPGQPSLQTYPTFSVTAGQPQRDGQNKNRIFNYYFFFFFLVLLVVGLATLLWCLHGQRRREQGQMRLRGQNALPRDVEQWAIHRRNRLPVVEGLNECGEAPPPYKAKEKMLGSIGLGNASSKQTRHIAVPQRVLWRGSTEHARLPEYVETIQLRDGERHLGPAQPVASIVAAHAGDSPA
ncbi:hypothetical protein SVAN01_05042 [Stagonosporopsis vannaccii]|nr:hypothetical protein SVAN01_05042 [Stagonosporopsis vannaccii]